MDYVGGLEQHRLMLEHARQHVSESAIVVRIYPELPDAGFGQLGFVPELSRVALHPQRQPESELFGLRRAGPADKMFLTYLNGQATAAYVPGGREGSQKRIAQRNLETYLALDLGSDSNMVGLILTSGGQDVGYVLLELGQQAEITGQRAAYFYDIVVEPNFHQQGAARALMNACQNWLVDHNWPVLIGDISKNNPVAYHGATKIVGCQLEFERWGLLLRQ
jgi:ribosomal protein S18 acetylase RimI-like enzyme